MSTFILVMVLLYNGRPVIATQEFNTLATCEAAKAVIRDRSSNVAFDQITCVAK